MYFVTGRFRDGVMLRQATESVLNNNTKDSTCNLINSKNCLINRDLEFILSALLHQVCSNSKYFSAINNTDEVMKLHVI